MIECALFPGFLVEMSRRLGLRYEPFGPVQVHLCSLCMAIPKHPLSGTRFVACRAAQVIPA